MTEVEDFREHVLAYLEHEDERILGYEAHCLIARIQEYVKELQVPEHEVEKLVARQAEDHGLWFEATTAAEAYLQQALRELHALVEQKFKPE